MRRGFVDRPATYLNKTYDETMALLIEARNYVAYREPIEQRTLPFNMRLQVSYESLRVTSRLTQVMAWLLASRAVHAGELTPDALISEQFALSGGSICSDASGPENSELPRGLRSLLLRSHQLYQRVSRLEEQARRSLN